jgi:hypothetical protein
MLPPPVTAGSSTERRYGGKSANAASLTALYDTSVLMSSCGCDADGSNRGAKKSPFPFPVRGNKTIALLSDAGRIELHCRKFHHACVSIMNGSKLSKIYFHVDIDFLDRPRIASTAADGSPSH